MTVDGLRSVRMASPPRVGPMALATSMLIDLHVPQTEIDAILGTDDPQLVHGYLALHRE